jgi:hypothetical protein
MKATGRTDSPVTGDESDEETNSGTVRFGATGVTETSNTTESAASAGGSETTDAGETGEATDGRDTADATDTTGVDTTSVDTAAVSDSQSYIIRRAVQDKSVQFERDERLTFFVHDDVANGERDLITDLQSALGRDVPKFDVREAVYRAALQNPDDVLEELLKMGYSLDDE